LRFWKLLIAARDTYIFPTERTGRFFKGEVNDRGLPDVAWHGTRLNKPGWNDPNAHYLAYTLGGFEGPPDLHVVLNMHRDALDFEVPVITGRRWYRFIDTARPSPEDIVETARQAPIEAGEVRVQGPERAGSAVGLTLTVRSLTLIHRQDLERSHGSLRIVLSRREAISPRVNQR
jgi:glycogen operon protein